MLAQVQPSCVVVVASIYDDDDNLVRCIYGHIHEPGVLENLRFSRLYSLEGSQESQPVDP